MLAYLAAILLRMLLAAWILFSLIVGASYTGNLKAYLSAPSFTKSINTIQVCDMH